MPTLKPFWLVGFIISVILGLFDCMPTLAADRVLEKAATIIKKLEPPAPETLATMGLAYYMAGEKENSAKMYELTFRRLEEIPNRNSDIDLIDKMIRRIHPEDDERIEEFFDRFDTGYAQLLDHCINCELYEIAFTKVLTSNRKNAKQPATWYIAIRTIHDKEHHSELFLLINKIEKEVTRTVFLEEFRNCEITAGLRILESDSSLPLHEQKNADLERLRYFRSRYPEWKSETRNEMIEEFASKMLHIAGAFVFYKFEPTKHYLDMGRLLVEIGNHERAKEMLKKAVELWDESSNKGETPPLDLRSARAAMEWGDVDMLMKLLTRLCKQHWMQSDPFCAEMILLETGKNSTYTLHDISFGSIPNAVPPFAVSLGIIDISEDWCEKILLAIDTFNGNDFMRDLVYARVAMYHAEAGRFEKAHEVLAKIPEKTDINPMRIVNCFARAYARHFEQLRDEKRLKEAVEYINRVAKRKGDRIELLKWIAAGLHDADREEESVEIYKQIFEMVDQLNEQEQKAKDDGIWNTSWVGKDDNRCGRTSNNLSVIYSEPCVKKLRKQGDYHRAVRIANEMYHCYGIHTHPMGIARELILSGDYDDGIAMDDEGLRILGYAAAVMYKNGLKDRADKVLDRGLEKINDEPESDIDHEFIIGLVYCKRYKDAFNLCMKVGKNERESKQFDLRTTIIPMLLSGNEKFVKELLSEWDDPVDRFMGTHTLFKWNYEEFVTENHPGSIPQKHINEIESYLVEFTNAFVPSDDQERYPFECKIHVLAAEVLFMIGKKAEAAKILEKAAVAARKIDDAEERRYWQNLIGLHLMKLGETDAAEDVLIAAIDSISATEKPWRERKLEILVSQYIRAKNPESKVLEKAFSFTWPAVPFFDREIKDQFRQHAISWETLFMY